MRILLFGSSSFAAQGLPVFLESKGHEVWTFDRAPVFQRTGRSLRGPYDQLDLAVAEMGSCDAVLVYALVKFRNVRENEELWHQILDAARKLNPSRLIMISSISVLSSNLGLADENAPLEDHPWKGEYARIKIAAERVVRSTWKESPLFVLRPGFILGEGILDPMVGMGRALPGGWMLGMGSHRTTIPLIERDAVHACVARLLDIPAAAETAETYMAVMPDPPSRGEYLKFMCEALGRGKRALHLPAWFWKLGLLSVSLPLSLLKRRWMRLDRTFEHNLGRRDYDCSKTSSTLDVDFSLEWKTRLLQIEKVERQSVWPGQTVIDDAKTHDHVRKVAYYGMGRIVRQKHLPALQQLGGIQEIAWEDPAPFPADEFPALPILKSRGIPSHISHAVVTAPLHAREPLQADTPSHLRHLLVEKPLLNSSGQWEAVVNWAKDRSVFVLHNYRFKSNVLAFRRYLQQHHPGRILRTTLHFETPSPANEMAPWMRREREHRILLTDYGLHFLDLAWVFFQSAATINRCDAHYNTRGEVESIAADMSFAEGTSTVFLRQGRHQRQVIIGYDFQNYSAQLRFFPDVFVPVFGGHGGMDDLSLATRSLSATAVKVGEKLGLNACRDQSHEKVLAAFLQPDPSESLDELSFRSLTPFYTNLCRLADRVYGSGAATGNPAVS
ncbi:NAD-dependent epimerase/dehydratase family protein [Verrucomicrobium sp. BvORR034]|uniref:NAD-dependent epimerase/dehydratase family protein n=1 Tax=Verrucomicrobium sp. BvORR034 TaxID=1396418 RepID=UPI000679D37C|nr:NAD-dependent epimerase/dehydratase family protein [Verrucomicrobium sp. BvORR034]